MGEWIFKSVSLSFFSGDAVHITGSNGSGKSTLLKVISGITLPSTGDLYMLEGNKALDLERRSNWISVCAPFVELFDHHPLREAIRFHRSLTPLKDGLDENAVLDICYLTASAEKRVGDLSSGMKQRLKLSLSILSEKPILFLDEPCSNLDAEGIRWYQDLLRQNSEEKLLLISSNNKEEEHFICKKTINLANYKK